MAKGRGWYTPGAELGFFSACERLEFVHISVFDLTQLSSTELEASVSGYTGAIFHSCSSVTEAHIRFRLFTAKVAKWFAGPDPFPGVGDMIMEIEIEDSDNNDNNGNDRDDDEEMEAEPQTATAELVIPKLPLAPQAGGPSSVGSIDCPAMSNVIEELPKSAPNDEVILANSALSDAADPLTTSSSNETTPSSSRPGDGWYVVHHAVLPGICYGV